MRMKTSSAKAKGRRLQQWVRNLLIEELEVHPEDIESRSMGAGGEDLIMARAARQKFPYSIECKNQERRGYKGVYRAYKQAETHLKNLEPVAIIKENGEKPLAVVSPEYLFQLQSKVAYLTDNELKIKGNGHAVGVVPITMSTSVSSLYS